MMKEARRLGDKLVVILNNDNWLKDKKGFVFMPQKERKELLQELPFVDRVIYTDHRPHDADRSVSRALRKLRPAVFANGGDRFSDNIPEALVCKALGIRTAFRVGRGGKVQSSSWMVRHAARGISRSVRPWGEFYDWDSGEGWHLKTIYIKPGGRLSLQYHKRRREAWLLVEGEAVATLVGKNGVPKHHTLRGGDLFTVPARATHRLESRRGCVIVELALGDFDENDIVRIADDYGRHDPKVRNKSKKA